MPDAEKDATERPRPMTLPEATEFAISSIEAYIAAVRKADPEWARHMDATERLGP